jgi:hypothetical protein
MEMRTLYTHLNNEDYETLRRLKARVQKRIHRWIYNYELISWLIEYASTPQFNEKTDKIYSFNEFIEQKVKKKVV